MEYMDFFYHYWFDGKLILEKPLELFLKNKDLDIHFCLSWANGSWTRQWIGNNEILLEQTHKIDKELWKRHFDYLLPFFKDKRAIYIDDKPVFLIYNPDFVKGQEDMFAYWNELARESGLDGIYFIAMKNYDFPNPNFLKNYNGLLKFQPRESNTASKNPYRQKMMSIKCMRGLPEKLQNRLNQIRLRLKSKTIIDSIKIWDYILANSFVNDYPDYKLDIYESAFFDWDNTARYRNKATIYTELSMEQKEKYLLELRNKACKEKKPYIFFNAWNEWSESAYLEPDTRNNYSHLEIIKNIFG